MLARILVRDRRRKGPVVGRYKHPTWIDPYPWIPGTVPEKMVFAELMSRRIEFIFQALGFPPGHENEQHLVARLQDIRPDFLIPSIFAAIEVQGTYFHTQPAAEQHDLDKATEYRAWGWKVYWLWDTDILRNVAEAVDSCPQLTGGPPLGHYLPKAKAGTETHPGATTADANAVALANQKRKRIKEPELRARARRGFRRTRVVSGPAKAVGLVAPQPLVDPALRYALQQQTRQMQAAKDAKRKRSSSVRVNPQGYMAAQAYKRKRGLK